MSGKNSDEGGSFWTTLPGIITAITALIVAITGLVTVLGDEGILNWLGINRLAEKTPTAFPTVTAVDDDSLLETPVVATQVVDPGEPDCRGFIPYVGEASQNGVVLAYSDNQLWVRYAELEPDIFTQVEESAYLFNPGYQEGDCLRAWVRYLSEGREVDWPTADSSQGRTYSDVWLSSPIPPQVGELVGWPEAPDMLLITVVDEDLNPDYVQVYHCGKDIPEGILSKTAYWHAATDVNAFTGYLTLYQANQFKLEPTVPCK